MLIVILVCRPPLPPPDDTAFPPSDVDSEVAFADAELPDTFTLTLGDQNGTNATGNNILVRVKLADGDSFTALSIE